MSNNSKLISMKKKLIKTLHIPGYITVCVYGAILYVLFKLSPQVPHPDENVDDFLGKYFGFIFLNLIICVMSVFFLKPYIADSQFYLWCFVLLSVGVLIRTYRAAYDPTRLVLFFIVILKKKSRKTPLVSSISSEKRDKIVQTLREDKNRESDETYQDYGYKIVKHVVETFKTPNFPLTLFFAEYILLSFIVIFLYAFILLASSNTEGSIIHFLNASILKILLNTNLKETLPERNFSSFISTFGSIISFFYLAIVFLAFSTTAQYRSTELYEKIKELTDSEIKYIKEEKKAEVLSEGPNQVTDV